ncbi:kinesin K39 [Pyrrhoderma noxium]|uniref:Kinesin K39 n=1 Tax=Pyrrhoderma noxium TaxID=2282107 RepID=A0A286UM30_9AGAM|nr:kinesin K39 [Pyrrhoderma noxium]
MDTTFEEDYSFAEANTSWASLVRDSIRNSYTYEEEGSVEIDLDTSSRSLFAERRERPQVDSETVEQLLRVLVQREALGDNLRLELEKQREEYKQEIQYRDERLHLTETQLNALHKDLGRITTENDALHIEIASLKAVELRDPKLKFLLVDEHKQIIKRVEDNARVHADIVEAEKSFLVLQLKRNQIQLAQLRNQIDDREYPEETLQVLVDRLRELLMADSQTELLNRERDERIASLERELQLKEKTCTDYRDRFKTLKDENITLSAAFNNAQEQSAKLQERLDEISDSAHTEQTEDLVKEVEEQLKEKEILRESAMADCENLRSLLEEAEAKHTRDSKELHASIDDLQTELSEARRAYDSVVSELESLKNERQTTAIAASENNQLTVELQDVKKQLEEVLLSREILRRQIEASTIHLLNITSGTRSLIPSVETGLANNPKDDINLIVLIDRFMVLLSEATTERSLLKEEVQIASLRLLEANSRNDQLNAEVQKLNRDLKHVKLTLEANFTGDYSKLESSGRLEKLTEEKNQIQGELGAVKRNLLDANSRMRTMETELEDALNTFKEGVSKIERDKYDLRSKLEQLTSEKTSLENELELAKSKQAESETQMKDQTVSNTHDNAEISALQKRLSELEVSLKEVKRSRMEVLRENERLRLSFADSEGDRAEVALNNEELLDKLHILEAEMGNSQHVHKEVSELKSKIQILEAENERLKAARQKMAEIYGLPTSPTASPDRALPPLRVGNPSRSSSSLSPSLGSAQLSSIEIHAPPSKRKRVGNPPTWSSTPYPGDFKSNDDVDSDLFASSEIAIPTEIKSPIQENKAYKTAARIASWKGSDDKAFCGFCSLSNIHSDEMRQQPLIFDSPRFPITFWNHCLAEHKSAIRPDPQEYIKLGNLPSKDETSDVILGLQNLISWRTKDGKGVCGLCRLEKNQSEKECPTEPNEFFTHCRLRHRAFFRD